MALKRKKRDESEIDVGAFSDIAFLLIIFFILTTSIVKLTGREITIPAAEKSEEKEQADNLTVSLAGATLMFGRGKDLKKVTLPEFKVKLAKLDLAAKKKDMDRMIVVEGKDDVPYQTYFRVVSAITEFGGILVLMEDAEESGGGKKGKTP
ncbi:MAG: ExbD/TolR family protein [Planctomycetota bacterium]|jgi:biopolymer transport protein ExbD